MRKRLIGVAWCAVVVGLLAAPGSLWAQQKTVKECNEEWTANKAAIQASGKRKKDFIAECRGTAPSAAAPAPAQPAPGAPSAGTKTAKQCNEEWTANKAAIQASGKRKKDFIAECRGLATSATPPAAAPVRPTPSAAQPERTQPAAPPPSARATPPTRAPATGVPAAAGQFATEAEARFHCPGDTVVWANLDSKIYHFNGTRDYGNTKKGAYMCERDTASAGFRAAKNEKHP
jgi:hypothetical protein